MIALLAALGGALAGDTWWVGDQAAAVALAAALAESWPDRSAEVIVGVPPARGVGLAWDGANVAWVGEGPARRAPAGDASTAVLLARSWAVPMPRPPAPVEPFVPAAPPVPEPRPADLPAPRAGGARFSAGLGARAVSGQPRPVEGVRVVGDALRGPLLLELDLFLGLALRSTPVGLSEVDEGEVRVIAMDRAGAGLSAGLHLGSGPVALRLLAGPELRWVEDWLFYRAVAREQAPSTRLGARAGLGVDLGEGRLALTPSAFGRVASGEPPSVGVALDLRVGTRPTGGVDQPPVRRRPASSRSSSSTRPGSATVSDTTSRRAFR